LGFASHDGCCAELGEAATGFAAVVVSAANFACVLSCAGTVPGVAGEAVPCAPGEAVPWAAECPGDPGPTAMATTNTNAIPEAALSEK
jgi:hypothetical protein